MTLICVFKRHAGGPSSFVVLKHCADLPREFSAMQTWGQAWFAMSENQWMGRKLFKLPAQAFVRWMQP
jgi:hypothetical protein